MLSCFFPTTIVCVDDNAPFLNNLFKEISSLDITIKRFLNPDEALRYINESSAANRLDCSVLVKEDEEGSASDWKSTLLNVNLLHQEIYNIERFSKISAVISDYSMPEMMGIELCSSIEDKNIQKILLTANADEKIAINAFNAGQISRFVKKDVDFIEGVKDSLKKCMHKYFEIYTDDISKYLSAGGEKTFLADPVFAKFFYSNCLGKEFVEYYMLDSFGGYMFLDSRGQPSFLSVLTESELNRIISVGEESGEASEDVLNKLKSREYMLVSHNRFGQLPPMSDWERHLKPARELRGYQTYYFSFADPSFLDIDADKIVSFEQFKKTQGPVNRDEF